MTDFVWPADLAPSSVSFYLQHYTGGTESPFNRQRKTYVLGRSRWVARFEFVGGAQGEGLAGKGAAIDAFLAQVGGGANRVLTHDWRRPTRSGPATGVGTNSPAAKGATSMTWIGLQANTLAFRRGDYVGGDGRAHIVTADVLTTAGGVAMVPFVPPLETAIAAGAGTYTEVKSRFEIRDDDAGANAAAFGDAERITVEMFEDL
ncbi:hypothetical protein [Sphingomonas montanisoli]|uniref:Uncharacterized protein n=1 Tax=Sphingomonas montanisoli TaxID=2606412 RepID=A0A5D9C639_9SPHN|nr:hypothetical protein [Sphingomonas montanisoli]TZG26510.1 hypothetical protein FYJ91_16445 [Sphingomonas montanisoli]